MTHAREVAIMKHIMVVDDSKTIRNLVAFVLKAEGFKVSTAEDGLDAIEKLYSLEPVDLIVSDVNMPRMDGFTFIKTLRGQDAYKDVPIIILSTEGQERDIQQGMSPSKSIDRDPTAWRVAWTCRFIICQFLLGCDESAQ